MRKFGRRRPDQSLEMAAGTQPNTVIVGEDGCGRYRRYMEHMDRLPPDTSHFAPHLTDMGGADDGSRVLSLPEFGGMIIAAQEAQHQAELVATRRRLSALFGAHPELDVGLRLLAATGAGQQIRRQHANPLISTLGSASET